MDSGQNLLAEILLDVKCNITISHGDRYAKSGFLHFQDQPSDG